MCTASTSRPTVLEQLHAKGGASHDHRIGDYTTTTVDGTFSLVYLVWNSLSNVTTQEGQVAAFANAAAHLSPGGSFVVELFVPQLRRLPPGQSFVPFDVTPEHLGFDEYDVLTQRLVSHHYSPGRGGYGSGEFRYAWPSELDLMARLAGMTLERALGRLAAASRSLPSRTRTSPSGRSHDRASTRGVRR